MKKYFAIVAAILAATLSFGQTPLPNDPAVKTGKLDNGLTYYIRHNDLPQGRAEFYLATNVGAIQETPDQDGLAHFLEHMCFNGLKNLPGKQMLEYLQHIGAEFGRNINASTGVEHTQYMLNNIPVAREGIVDTCLLVMHDYSHFVLNEPSEIDAERGVILEEKRTRNTASWRMFEQSAPYIYGKDSKYAGCNIIGSEENLKNFKPESLKAFYETWYRPDMQALIVVGDIDVEQIYGKIVKLFADVPAPEQPTVKVMPEVEINEDTRVGIITDPENTFTGIEFLWKTGKPTPKEINGTDAGYVERLLKRIVRGVMAERFDDITSKPGAPFLAASFSAQNLCENLEAYVGDVTFESGKALEAGKAYLLEIEKMKKFGFTDDEVNRVKENILKGLKDKVAGESTRKNPEFIRSLINNFFSGMPYMDPQTELMIAQAICSQISAAQINAIIPQVFTGEHLTIIYTGVDKEGETHPTEEQMLAMVEEVKNTKVEANAVEVIEKDFMAGTKIKAGKVSKASAGEYGSTVWQLSNGLKVVVLPTEYKKDQVIFNYRKKGGLLQIPTEDLASFDSSVSGVYAGCKGVASFPASTVSKMLTGKSVKVDTYFSTSYNGISGSCTPEDLETALQLMYLEIASPRFDQAEWDVAMNQISAVLPNMTGTPNYALQKHMYNTVYAGSPRKAVLSEEILAKANLQTYKKYYELLFKDVAGATLYIVGNVDLNTLKPLVEKYAGALKKGGKAFKDIAANIPGYSAGDVKDEFTTKMKTPKATVFQFYNADVKYDVQKEVNLQAAEFILDMIYTETLREEEGGTYGASASLDVSYEPLEKAIIQVYFDTNVEKQTALRALAIKGLKELAQNGPTQEQLTRAIENAKKNIPEKRITNGWWMGALRQNATLGGDYDAQYEAAVSAISAEGIKAALGEILSSGNFAEVVMLPE